MDRKPPQFDSNYYILSLASRIQPSAQDLEALEQAMVDFDDWDRLITDAENFSVAPLLFTNLRASKVAIPVEQKMKLFALVQRHKHENLARTTALNEITSACNRVLIPVIVLKGAFLAHSIYPDPSLRPMSDIDILVPPDRELEVMQILRNLGYSAPENPGSQYMNEHHHLPGAHKTVNSQQVLVEVHHSALSGDATARLDTGSLTEPVNRFRADGTWHYSLGHIDQLRHLYHHMSEPAERLKLSWCVDLVYYASHFAEQINWKRLRNEFPEVVNAIRLVGFIIRLPDNLRPHFPESHSSPPAGTGISILPLTTLLREPFSIRLHDLLYPSDWWLMLYYGVPPGHSLILTRWARHPWQVLKWVLRRILASRHGN
jgi:hypothetical protein